jgi:hypothetical protein
MEMEPLPQKDRNGPVERENKETGATENADAMGGQAAQYQVSNMDELCERVKQYRMRQILQVESNGDFSVLIWKKPQEERPRERSNVLVKYMDEIEGVLTCDATYVKERFWCYDLNGGREEIDEREILGWDYYPYNEG